MITALHFGRWRLARLREDTSGLALIEFAFSLPLLLSLILTGAELTNYATTRMRISQVALHLADHASRLGEGSPLVAKQITEANLNDVLTGADLQAGELKIYENGRVILSSLQPVADPNPTNLYRIAWQRCRGITSYTPQYGRAGDTNLPGMGRAGALVTAPPSGQTMFVEVRYRYRPLIRVGALQSLDIAAIAAMPVRDRRDTSDDSDLGSASLHPNGIYKVAGVTASTC